VVDINQGSLIVELTGTTEKIDSAVQMLRPFGIKEMVRTGVVAMTRGGTSIAQAQVPVNPRLRDVG
jgi:acetolactate synthase-1/3 small subunit